MEEMKQQKELTIEEKARLYDEIMAMRTDKARRAIMKRSSAKRKADSKKAAEIRWAKYRKEHNEK